MKLQKTKAKKIIIGSANGEEKIEEIDASHIRKGDTILINTGDKIPVDGDIYWGYGSADESMISGESLLVDKSEGAHLIGGTILMMGGVKMKATAIGEETVLSQIIDMVKNAQQDKPHMQNLADRISAIFVPLVVGIALLRLLISLFVIE